MLVAALAVLLVGGCGMSTGGGDGSATTTMQPVGPAAPSAARAEQPASSPAIEPGTEVSAFLRVVGSTFDALSLSFAEVALSGGAGPDLAGLAPAAVAGLKPDVFQLIAAGRVPAGEYDALRLAAQGGDKGCAITVAGGEAATPLRLPRSVDLQFEPIEARADDRLVLVVTLDLTDLPQADEIAIAARRFQAGPLAEDEACAIRGTVAPAASLARVYACWADTGTTMAVTQADPFTGEYLLEGLPPGSYHLRVTAAGCKSYEGPDEPIAIAAGTTAELPPIALVSAESARGI